MIRLLRPTSAASFTSKSWRFFELICSLLATKVSISVATFRSIYNCSMSEMSLAKGYLRKKLRTRISLMFDFLLKREFFSVCDEGSFYEWFRASGFRRLRAWIAFILPSGRQIQSILK